MSTYQWLMEINKLPENRKNETDEHLISRTSGCLDGILDAWRDLGIWTRHRNFLKDWHYKRAAYHMNKAHHHVVAILDKNEW